MIMCLVFSIECDCIYLFYFLYFYAPAYVLLLEVYNMNLSIFKQSHLSVWNFCFLYTILKHYIAGKQQGCLSKHISAQEAP